AGLREGDADRARGPLVRVGQDVDQVRNRRTRIAADVAHAGLEQRLGDGEDPLATEEITGAVSELLDVLRERPLPHAALYAIRALLLLRDDLVLDLVVGCLGHDVLLRQVVLPLVRAPVDDLLRARVADAWQNLALIRRR